MFFLFVLFVFGFCIAAFGPGGIIIALVLSALGGMAVFAGGD